MERYFIESVKCGVGEGGMACGPVDGPVVAEAKVKTESGDVFYLALAEVMGTPNFFKTKESSYEIHMDPDEMEEELDAIRGDYLDLGCDYEEVLEHDDDELYQLYRYLIYLVRAEWDECEAYQKETEGKWIDEIEITPDEVYELPAPRAKK